MRSHLRSWLGPVTTKQLWPWFILATIIGLWLASQIHNQIGARAADFAIAGRVINAQQEPIRDAEVTLYLNGSSEPFQHEITHADGTYILILPDDQPIRSIQIVYERTHYQSTQWVPDLDDLAILQLHGGLIVPDTVLERRITAGFWIATAIFVLMLVFIATERLHNTLAALAAIALVFAVSFVGGAWNPDLFILTFEQALTHVDFEVIFLLLGMMIVIGIIEDTGIFQWLAYQAYRLSRGKVWLLAVILMLITAITSALLDNVITMLLVAPISLQIALAMGINPLSLLIPEILSSNIGGIATLVGTPTNILIGSYAGFGFNDFLTHLTPGVLLAEVGLIAYALIWYRAEYRKTGKSISKALLQRLEENAQIKNPKKLLKSGVVFGVLLILFVVGEQIHLTPAVSAIIGAVGMLIWVDPDIEQMMTVVDWTTLMFFIGLFMMVGAVQEVGLIDIIATGIGQVVGDRPVAALIVIIWVSALGSGLIENIPFAAAMLPVVRYLARAIPGADAVTMYYGLSIGAGMGGNSSLIGSSPNLVTAGIAERAGFPIRFVDFLKVGLPATVITVAMGLLWLLLHF